MAMREDNGIQLEQKPLPAQKTLEETIRVPVKSSVEKSELTPSVVLRQSSFWSRVILWGLVGMTSSVFIWANIAKIEEAIPTQGKLEPEGTVREVQVPVGGVVKAIYVKDGQKVRRGDLLLRLDSTADRAEFLSLQKIRNSLRLENQFYRHLLATDNPIFSGELLSSHLTLPANLLSLAKSRTTLLAENRLYRLQLSGSAPSLDLTPEEEARLEFSRTELDTRVADVRLQTEQLENQLSQTQIQMSSARKIQLVNEGILNSLKPLVREGALSRLQYLKQEQEVETRRSEVHQLVEEQARLRSAIAQSRERQQNTVVAAKKDLLTKIADNEKQIAQIDSELNKALLENEKRIAEVESQISQTRLTLKYQELRAPSDGIVFDLKATSPGFVTNASQPVLKIVPDEALNARVYITNKDIGFVKEGMIVDVRIDSFPFSEFGDIKGELVWIGSDALPPEEVRPYYSFPAKIRLDQQSLTVNTRKLPLQSGMSVTANIKVRDRTVISIFTDLFAKQIDALKSVR